MQLYNNTPQQLFYSIGSPGAADCGTIDAGQSTELPYYDKTANVTVSFQVNTASPNPAPLVVNIPSTGTGKAVTIGLSFI